MNSNIFLIGMMGCGKSTIAPILSKSLNIPYIDTDKDLISILDMNMKTIFNEIGEKKFRVLESVYFQEHIRKNNNVYALGGGIILDSKNRNLIQKKGSCIFLDVSIDELINRLNNNIHDRPLINSKNFKQSLIDIYNSRYKIYKSLAVFSIKCDNKNINEVVRIIIEKLNNI